MSGVWVIFALLDINMYYENNNYYEINHYLPVLALGACCCIGTNSSFTLV